MEPTQLSAAAHKLDQNHHPKCLLEVPVEFFHHRVRSRGALHTGLCPAVFRLPQPMGTLSILFSYTGGGQSFQGLERPEIPPAPGETRH